MASNRQTGSQTLAYCSQCASVLDHVVVSAMARRTSQVRCSSCGDVHPYRKAQPNSGRLLSASKKQEEEERLVALATASFDSLMADQDLEKALPYECRACFQAADLIAHKTFGAGIVVRTIAGSKVEVQFRHGRKILVHDRVLTQPDKGRAPTAGAATRPV